MLLNYSVYRTAQLPLTFIALPKKKLLSTEQNTYNEADKLKNQKGKKKKIKFKNDGMPLL